VTSNVGQNYPYTSESHAERVAVIDKLVREREGLADTIKAEATPLDDNDRWWVWKCPTPGCPGLLHAAGYSAEKHAVFVVCDGTCGKTFLRLTKARPSPSRRPISPRAGGNWPSKPWGSASRRRRGSGRDRHGHPDR